MSKTEDYAWAVLKPDVFAAIMDHFSSGEPLFTDASAAASDTAINDDDTEVGSCWYRAFLWLCTVHCTSMNVACGC